MKLAIGNDHAAVELKFEIMEHLKERGIEVVNVGTDTHDRFNYPVAGYKVAKMVAAGEVDGGVLICGTGVGKPLRQQSEGHPLCSLQRAVYGETLQAAQQYQHHRLRRPRRRTGPREDDRGRMGRRRVPGRTARGARRHDHGDRQDRRPEGSRRSLNRKRKMRRQGMNLCLLF